MSIADKLQTIAANEQRVFDAGKKAAYDAFWDSFQQSGNRTRYSAAFGSSINANYWNDNTYNPKYPIVIDNTNGAFSVFESSAMTDTKVEIDLSQMPSGSTVNRMFTSNTDLKTIRKIILHEGITFSDSFVNCLKLCDLTIEGVIGQNGFNFQWSPLLTKESITSVVNALSPNTNGLTVTFSQTAVNNAFTAEEWVSLTATKPNWNMQLL